MHPDWVSNLLRQCQSAKVPFHFKQWGHWAPTTAIAEDIPAQTLKLAEERPVRMVPLGKKAAGRVLEGATWDGFPRPIAYA